MSNLSFLASIKIPEFIREDYPALVTFVEAYYRFVENLEGINTAADIDATTDKYLKLYKETVARGFGDSEYLDIRKFIFANKDFFSRKGTPDAFIFFFKAYFGEEINVRTPNYLIASGGDITGSYYFFVSKTYGVINQYDILEITTNHGPVNIDVTDVTLLDSGTYAVYFVPPRGFSSQVDDVCKVKDGSSEVFVGKIKATPYRIVATTPGQYWQLGQVIQLPSTTPGGTSTIARVTRITPESGIDAIEVIQFGYPNNALQYTISSLSSQPETGLNYIEYDKNLISEGVYQHVLTIHDNMNGLSEHIVGAIAIVGGSSYFSQNYILEDYVGTVVLDQTNDATISNDATAQDHSTAEYQASLATLRILTGPLSREKTSYASENSLVSNQNTKLHDNLFYQAYAYSIETSHNIGDYRGSIDLIHPAGMKFSAVLTKNFTAVNTTATVAELSRLHIAGASAVVSPGSVGKMVTLGMTGVSGTGIIP